MDIVTIIIRFFHKRFYWLIGFPLLTTLLVIYMTNDLPKKYTSSATIYTGTVSGYNIDNNSGRVDWNQSNNAMDNYTNMIRSYSTLSNVSLELFAQHIMYGNPNHDTPFITAEHLKPIWNHTPDYIRALVDSSSFDKTVENMKAFRQSTHDNYLYGLFMWDYSYYGKSTLEGIKITRINSSDMIKLTYTNDDPNVVYHTLMLLNKEFINQNKILKNKETDNAIKYFTQELEKLKIEINDTEEQIKDFNIKHRVINYDEQTKQIAIINTNQEEAIKNNKILLESSNKIIDDLSKKFELNHKILEKNDQLIHNINVVTELNSQKDINNIFNPLVPADSLINTELQKTESNLHNQIINYADLLGKGEILISKEIAIAWLDALVNKKKAEKSLKVLYENQKKVDDLFTEYSPINVYINQQNRKLEYLNQEFKSLFEALNEAKVKQQNNNMVNSTLQVITPPLLPLRAEPTKRRIIVAGSFAGSFMFILIIFIILELINATLDNKVKTENITEERVIGALPKKYKNYLKKYNKLYEEKSLNILCNTLLGKLPTGNDIPHIINVISFDNDDIKKSFTSLISKTFQNLGHDTRIVDWEEAYNKKDPDVRFPITIDDILALCTSQIIIINHPKTNSYSIDNDILKAAFVNVILVDANASWNETDKINIKNLKSRLKDDEDSLFLCLNNASRRTVEDFTGNLPPHLLSFNNNKN